MNAKANALQVIPNPQPHRPVGDDDDPEAVRRLHCRRYDACLDVAIGGDWPGFTCQACAAFVPLTPDGEYRDLRGLLELAAHTLAADEEKKKQALPGAAAVLHRTCANDNQDGEDKE